MDFIWYTSLQLKKKKQVITQEIEVSKFLETKNEQFKQQSQSNEKQFNLRHLRLQV